jgi:hypothetical protein
VIRARFPGIIAQVLTITETSECWGVPKPTVHRESPRYAGVFNPGGLARELLLKINLPASDNFVHFRRILTGKQLAD